MTDTIVHKYGGSSISAPENVERIARITENENSKLNIVVVSAPGKTAKSDKKITDMLLAAAQGELGLLDNIIDIYTYIFPGLDFDHLRSLFEARIEARDSQTDAEFLDSMKSAGEEACARSLAESKGYVFVDPKDVIAVSDDFGRTKILSKAPEKIRDYFSGREGIFVIPEFYGGTEDGRIATFSRGGSDITGALLAASLHAKVYNKFTDRDGVFAADPRIVPDAHRIRELTFRELRDLSYSGFNIFHSEAIEPIEAGGVPVHIRNTSSYPREGTYVVSSRASDPSKPIVGVAYQDGFSYFNISRTGLNDIRGVLSDLTNIFRQQGLSIDHVLTGIDDISIVFNRNQNSRYDARFLEYRIKDLAGAGTKIGVQDDIGCPVIAGIGIKDNRLISSDVEHTIVADGIDVLFKSQGAERRCVVLGICSCEGKAAVKLIYDKYID